MNYNPPLHHNNKPMDSNIMITDIEKITIVVSDDELLFIACPMDQLYNLQFQTAEFPSASIPTREVSLKVLKFHPPELSYLTVEQYLSQKLATLAFNKISFAQWIEVFRLEDDQNTLLSAIDLELSIKLQLLLSVVDQSELVLIPSNIECIKHPGLLLTDIICFCDQLNWPYKKPKFVVYGEDIDSRWFSAVDKIIEIESGGIMREWGIEI